MTALPRRSLSRVLRAAAPSLLLSMMAALAACGGAEAKAPQTQEPRETRQPDGEPATIEEAQDQISRARDLLAVTSTEAQPGAAGGTATTSQVPSPSAPPAAEPARPADTSPRKSASPPKTGETSRCANPCRALASMRRAVTALCRMTGDADNRCLDAKRTLADSEGRIPPCSC